MPRSSRQKKQAQQKEWKKQAARRKAEEVTRRRPCEELDRAASVARAREELALGKMVHVLARNAVEADWFDEEFDGEEAGGLELYVQTSEDSVGDFDEQRVPTRQNSPDVFIRVIA